MVVDEHSAAIDWSHIVDKPAIASVKPADDTVAFVVEEQSSIPARRPWKLTTIFTGGKIDLACND